jgi:UPF0148 protein
MARKDEKGLRSMVDMLRSGAKMLDLQCPACSSPLFRLKNGEIWCANCSKRVVIVRREEDELRVASRFLLSSIEETILKKIGEINELLREEDELDRINELSLTLYRLLENLEKVRKASGLS